ncbi:MAG: histidine kinase [Myxococcales bacterium]|nr:histidine kinase [Myxococcales bacterium]
MTDAAPASSARIEWLDERSQPLLPPGMWVVYLLAPVAGSILLLPNMTRPSREQLPIVIAVTLLPYVVLTLTLHGLFTYVAPSLVRRIEAEWKRWLLYVALVTTVAAVGALAMFALVRGDCSSSGVFVAQCVVISATITLPALAVQRFRVRAIANEQQMIAERQASLRAKLSALTARTNPHFFFNAVNTVACLIPEDPALAERTLERLAELFRYAMASDEAKVVSLAREVEMLKDYLEIQVARFGDKLRVSVELDPAVAAVAVPPLLLQPLVENAVLHGVNARGHGHVRVHARREGELVVVTVCDDGPGPGASAHKGTQTSMNDLRARLALLYPEGGRLALQRAPEGGCVARVELPMAMAMAGAP